MNHRGRLAAMRRRGVALGVAFLTALTLGGGLAPGRAVADTSTATDLLPKIAPLLIGIQNNDLAEDPTGTVWLRYDGYTANSGVGDLDIVGMRPKPALPVDKNNDTMPAFQRIHRSDGSFRDVPGLTLVYNPNTAHWTLADIAQYHLFDSTGREVKTGEKLYYCLGDVFHSDPTLPGSPQGRGGHQICEQDANATSLDEGIDIGWADVYGMLMIDQSMDVTDLMSLPAQTYTLRMVTNPDNLIVDLNGAPQSVDTPVTIGIGVPVKTWGGPRPGI